MSPENIRTQYQANILAIADRNNMTSTLKFDTKQEAYISLGFKKSNNVSRVHDFIMLNIIDKAKDMHTHFFDKLYTKKDVQYAIDVLENFVLDEWFNEIQDLEQTLNQKLDLNDPTKYARIPLEDKIREKQEKMEELIHSQKHMKAINSLEKMYNLVNMPEDEQKKIYISGMKTACNKVRKIFDNDTITHQLALKQPVLKALTILKGYHHKLTE